MTKTKRRLLAVLSRSPLSLVGTRCFHLPGSGVPSAQRTSAVENEAVSVYFPGESGKLEKKTGRSSKAPDRQGAGRCTVRELKDARSIPDRLKLYELALGRDGVLYLNLSREFIDRMSREKEITVVTAS